MTRLLRHLVPATCLGALLAAPWTLEAQSVTASVAAGVAGQSTSGSVDAFKSQFFIGEGFFLEDLSLSARGDRGALRLALMNLVDDAIKYGLEGSRGSILTGRSDAMVWVEVVDEGPGIAPEHRAHVFDRFYRIDEGRSRGRGGTGLGLALVKWTAEAHRGRVELDSEPGRGSRFRIVLPAAGRTG